MAQGVGRARIIRGGLDIFGGHLFGIVDYSGPKSYVSGGDAIDPRYFAFPNTILTLVGSVDQSFTFRLEPRPVQNGYTAWQLIWTVYATGEEVYEGANLSGFTGRLTAIGF